MSYKRNLKFLSATKRRILRKARSKTVSALDIVKILDFLLTARRVRHILSNDQHLVFKKRLPKPPLKDVHRKARLKFSRKYMSWTSEWKNVIFSDEKSLTWTDLMVLNTTATIR